jgi:hypothetical protein
MAAMHRGDFAGAWQINDLVLAGRDPLRRDDPRLPYHMRWVWAGEPYRGRHVLVRCYHGLGDTLQFARYLPALRAMTASVTLEAQPELCAVLEGMADHVVRFRRDAPLPPMDCNIEIMELPHALRLTPGEIPSPPYVRWGSSESLPHGAIGVCWRSGDWDPERALPDPLAARLVGEAGSPVVSLQPGPTPLSVLNPGGCPVRIEETATLIAGLGLVIAVDTMVAHLAGAMNRPTWLLLKHEADWRWMADRDDSPWYPATRLYRQPAPGDWDSVVSAVLNDLRAARPQGRRFIPSTRASC